MTGEAGEDSTRPDGAFEGTIDWNRYWCEWRAGDGDPSGYDASVSHHHVDRLERFFGRVGVPDSAAFVGCGPGNLAAAVARTHPGTGVFGYDAAEFVVEANRRDYADVQNLAFEVAVLPGFEVDRTFDLVFCYATLHYVRDAPAAVRNLYRQVAPGGHLICHYPNDRYRENHGDVRGQLRERLHLPLSGVNLLSAERIETLLDARVRDFWEIVDAEGPVARAGNPCVVVEK